MSVIRLARAVDRARAVLKFAGAYHGHVDGLLAQAGRASPPRGSRRARASPRPPRRRP